MGKCLLVAGGAVSAPLLKKIFREDEFAYVFAVDRGLETLDACGIWPTHLVGDFDSVRPEVLEKYLTSDPASDTSHLKKTGMDTPVTVTGKENLTPEGTEFPYPAVERLIPEKDDTDTEHAMRQAAGLHPDEIVLMGGFGTRFDHVLANLHTLTIPLRAGIPACMLDGTNRVRLLEGPTAYLQNREASCGAGKEGIDAGTESSSCTEKAAELCIKKRDARGKYISLLPLTTEVTGITLEGFKYSLSNADFRIGETVSLGVSNELAAEEGVIRIKTGILAVIESADGV